MNCLCLVLFCIIFSISLAVNDYNYYNLTCETSASKTVKVNVCECTKKKIFLDFTVSRPLNFSMTIKFYQKRGKKMFEVFKTPLIDWCKMMDGRSQAARFQKFVLKTLQASVPNFFQKCPYQGKFTLFNISSPRDVVEIFPLGHIKLSTTISDLTEKNIVTFSFFLEVFK
ncbi:hypothetical protein ACKWTF_003798 [Chironomus riparius]